MSEVLKEGATRLKTLRNEVIEGQVSGLLSVIVFGGVSYREVFSGSSHPCASSVDLQTSEAWNAK